MLKFGLKSFIIALSLLFMVAVLSSRIAWAGGSCSSNGEFVNPDSSAETIDSHNVIPQEIMNNIVKINKAIDKKVSRFLALGRIVECAGTDFLAKEWHWLVVKVRFPDILLWLAGFIVWILGILLVLIVGYYLCDISFKLGFAILSMPIAIALWPFEKTKQYLGRVINMMMHSTGIFIFLSLGATYAVALFDAATNSYLEEKLNEACLEYGVGCPDLSHDPLLEALKGADAGTLILKIFDLSSFNFLLLLFAGIYGFNLIGDTVTKYAQKFFPDHVLGGQNPMHSGLTKATDFAKQQVGKAGALAKDIAITQGKRVGAKAGGKVSSAIRNVGKGMQKAAEKMGPAGILVKGLGKAMEKAGKTGENMAKSHENKYQNQGKKGEVKNGVWQPKEEGGGSGKKQNNMGGTGANIGQGGAGANAGQGGAGGAANNLGGAGGSNPAGGGAGGSNPAGGGK